MFRKRMTTVLYAVLFGSIFIITLNLLFSFFGKQDSSPVVSSNAIVTDLTDQSKKYFDMNLVEAPDIVAPMKGYGLLLLDSSGNRMIEREFTYEGEPSSYFVTVINSTDEDTKAGLLLFAQDKLLPFQVDGNEPAIVHSFDIDSHAYLHVPVSFHPQLTSSDEPVPLFWVLLHGLGDPIDPDALKSYFTTSSQATLTADGEHALAEAGGIVPMIESLPKREGIVDYKTNDRIQAGFSTDGFEINVFDGYGFRVYEQQLVIDRKHGNREIAFEAFGAPGSYTTAIFIDHQPIEIEGANQFQWSITDEEMIHVSFEVDESLPAGQYIMYSITFPTEIDGNVRRPIESNQYIITVK